MTVPLPAAVAILVAAYTLADRSFGGGLKWRPGNVGLSKVAPLLLFPIVWAVGVPWGLSLGLLFAWFVVRSPAWKTFGGDLAPHRDRYLGTFLRHCLVVGFILAFSVYFQGFDVRTLLFMAYPVAATLLAIQYRKMENERGDIAVEIRPPDNGALIELTRGAILGALVAAVLVWTGVLS